MAAGQAAVFQLPARQVVGAGLRIQALEASGKRLQDGRFAVAGNGLDHGLHVGAEQEDGGHARAGGVNTGA
jgi:hypothetical protein